jgi:hypothetical protein
MFELETGNAVHHECRRLRTYPVRLNDADELLVTMRRKDKPRAAETDEPVAIEG